MELTENQFTPYARNLVRMIVEAHIEALQSLGVDEHTAGRVEGIRWMCHQIGIDIDVDVT